jgi:crotonobetainyl-CoA:carnitine CoA-transferase CaiB-like acyl-CoA transferase
VVGILAALRQRDQTGEGAHLDMALLDVQTSVLANQAMNYLASGQAPRRMGNAHPNIVPYQVFPVADGHVIVAVGNDGQFARFVSVLGRPELAQDERFGTNAGRVGHRAALVPLLTELTLQTTRDALLAALEGKGVPAGPINTVADVFADPQVIARGMKIDLPSPLARGGAIPSVRSPIVMNGQPMAASRPSPRLGEHTDEVLSDPSWMA